MVNNYFVEKFDFICPKCNTKCSIKFPAIRGFYNDSFWRCSCANCGLKTEGAFGVFNHFFQFLIGIGPFLISFQVFSHFLELNNHLKTNSGWLLFLPLICTILVPIFFANFFLKCYLQIFLQYGLNRIYKDGNNN